MSDRNAEVVALTQSAVRLVDDLFTEKKHDWLTADSQRVMLTREECLKLISYGADLILLAQRTPEKIEQYLASDAPEVPSHLESR